MNSFFTCLLVLQYAFTAKCTPVPDYTFNVVVPSPLNATNHNSPDIFCVVPAPWFGVMLFYLGNYAAHAATLITYPGEDPIYIGAAILYALFFPTTGIVRGLNAIFRRARVGGKFPFIEDSALRVAARAGALCMVVRTEKWRPKTLPTDHVTPPVLDQEKSGATSGASETQTTSEHERPDPVPVQGQSASISTHSGLPIWRMIEGYWCKELPWLWPFFDTSLERPEPYRYEREGLSIWRSLWESMTRMERKIHGTVVLPGNGHGRDEECTKTCPSGCGYYSLAYVPRHAQLEPFHKESDTKEHIPTSLSSSYSFVKGTIAIIQVLYASATVYKATRGPQIDQYGFAAFGLTVIPYLIMTLINLAGNIVTPNYDSLYLVHSEILEEAVEVHHAMIDGAVGKLVVKNEGTAQIEVEDKLLNKAITRLRQLSQSESKDSSTEPTESKIEGLIPMDTKGVKYFPPTKPSEHGYYVAFSCPIFERVDKIRTTRVLEDKKPGKTWGGYFNYKNRAEIAIPWWSYFFFTFISLLLGSISLLPIGLLSKFRERSSTHEQRVWIACWTVFGFVIGTFAGFWTSVLDLKTYHGIGLSKGVKFLGKILFAALFAAPGVGGFIMVGKMLREYGNCVNLF